MTEPKEHGITGRGQMRDTLIVCNALAYAILTIGRLPIERQESSNREDMIMMLEHIASKFLGVEYFMDGARRHMDGDGFDNSGIPVGDNVVVIKKPRK